MTETPQYSDQQLADQEDAAQQHDHAVAAVVSVLLGLYVTDQVAQGFARAPKDVASGVVYGSLSPILVPFGVATLAGMLPRGATDVRDWKQLAESTVAPATVRVAEAYPDFKQQQPSRLLNWVQGMARSIVTAATEAVKAAAAQSMGYDSRRWLTRLDDRVRPAHAMLEGVVQPLGEPFQTVGGYLMHPGDQTAPANLWAGCRCSTEYVRSKDLA